MPGPRPARAGQRSQNPHGHVTRTVCEVELFKENAAPDDLGHRAVLQVTFAMEEAMRTQNHHPRAPAAPVAHDQSTSHFACKLTRKIRYATTQDTVLCESVLSKCTRATLYRNLQGKCRMPRVPCRSNSVPNTCRKNPSVWPHSMGKNLPILVLASWSSPVGGPPWSNYKNYAKSMVVFRSEMIYIPGG